MEQLAQSKFKTGLRWLMGSGVLALTLVAGVVGYGFLPRNASEAVGVQFVSVELGTVEKTLSEGGQVELGQQQIIKSPQEGAIEKILVSPGDQVVAGQTLLILQNPDRETILSQKQVQIQQQELIVQRNREKVEEAQEDLEIAREVLAYQHYKRDLKEQTQIRQNQLESQQKQITIERNRQKVVESEADLIAALEKLKQTEILLEKGFIPGQELENVKNDIRQKQSALKDAKVTLETSILDLRNHQIKLPEEVNIDDGVPEAEVKLRDAKSEFNRSLRDLEGKKLEYQKEAEKLESFIVDAPISGMILNIKAKQGEGVKISDELLTIGDPNEELIKLQLSTLNAVKVKPGQEVRVNVIGPNSQPFFGRIQSLDILANKSSTQSFFNNEKQVIVPATVKLNQPTETLIPNSGVNVDIILEQRNNVVVLDFTAIQSLEDEPFVWLKDATGKAQKRSITLGLEGLTTLEVKSGLNVGEVVAIPPPDVILTPGTPLIEAQNPEPTP